ncbi:MAG: hypothetical protein NVSMB47_20670 [Polyangiales bacterium]
MAMLGACSSAPFEVAAPKGDEDSGGGARSDVADVGGADTTTPGTDTSPPGAETSAKDSTAVDVAADVVGSDGATAEAIVTDGAPVDLGVLPTITIDHPGDSACWLGAGTQLVKVSVTGWTLADPATCAGKARCGPVYVTIDGTNCDAPGLPYNTYIGASGASDLDLSLCKGGMRGTKLIHVELHNDDGTVFIPTVSASQSTDFTGPC